MAPSYWKCARLKPANTPPLAARENITIDKEKDKRKKENQTNRKILKKLGENEQTLYRL